MSDPQFQRPIKLALGRHECLQTLYTGNFLSQDTTGRAVFLFRQKIQMVTTDVNNINMLAQLEVNS